MNDITKSKLRRMTWALTRTKPTRYQRNVRRVMLALRDEATAARLAELAESVSERVTRERDLAARKAWLARFESWEGEDVDAVAEEFCEAMAGALSAFAASPPEYVTDRAPAVADALDAVEDSRAFQRSPGRARLSAALRALGFSSKAVDRALDFDRKA